MLSAGKAREREISVLFQEDDKSGTDCTRRAELGRERLRPREPARDGRSGKDPSLSCGVSIQARSNTSLCFCFVKVKIARM